MTNKIQDAFDEIKASEELKSSTMQFLRMERKRRSLYGIDLARGRAFVAACAMFALVLGVGGYTIRKPVSYISIDVNPSVELALNRYDRVAATAAYNEEGKEILRSVDIKGRRYTDAIDTIVDSPAMQTYLAGDAVPIFTVAANDSGKQAAIQNGIENCSGCQRHQGKSYTADMNSISEAHESGLSFGKYAAYLELSQYDDTVTAEDCRDMSMSEIHRQINEHERDNEHGGNGNRDGKTGYDNSEQRHGDAHENNGQDAE